VASLASRAWQLRDNITFPDACYVALAESLNYPLLTADQRLVAAPTLPISTLHLTPPLPTSELEPVRAVVESTTPGGISGIRT
jgi:hypothetical protein